LRPNLVRSLFACVFSGVWYLCCVGNCSSCLGDSGIPLQVVIVGTTGYWMPFVTHVSFELSI